MSEPYNDECKRMYQLLDDEVERLEANLSCEEYFTWGWLAAIQFMKRNHEDVDNG